MANVERTDYENALHAWATSIVWSGWEVIFEDADGPRPKGKYVTLNIPSMPRVGHGEKRVLDEANGDEFKGELQVHFEATCEVVCFGKTARAMIEILRNSIELPSVLESTEATGLSLAGTTASLNLTQIDGTRSVPRYQSDFFFAWSDVTYYEAEVIETFTATET